MPFVLYSNPLHNLPLWSVFLSLNHFEYPAQTHPQTTPGHFSANRSFLQDVVAFHHIARVMSHHKQWKPTTLKMSFPTFGITHGPPPLHTTQRARLYYE